MTPVSSLQACTAERKSNETSGSELRTMHAATALQAKEGRRLSWGPLGGGDIPRVGMQYHVLGRASRRSGSRDSEWSR